MDPEFGSHIVPPDGWKVHKRMPMLHFVFELVCLVVACAAVAAFYPALDARSPPGSAALLSMLLSGLSQALVQFVRNRVDNAKIGKFLVWGTVNGLWVHFWTGQLASKFEWTVTRVAWDQLYGNPLAVFGYVCFSAYWDGHAIDAYLQEHYMLALRTSLMVWPVASVAQFLFIPGQYVVVFNTAINFGWMIYLGIR